MRTAIRYTLLLLAVAAVSAGGATAASKITGRQVKDGSLTGRDVKNRSLSQADIRPASVTKKSLSGATVRQLVATPTTTQVSSSQPIAYDPDRHGYVPDSAAVSCPDGQVALGGGGAFQDHPDLGNIGGSRPVLDAQGVPRGWIVSGRPAGDGDTLNVYAVCSPQG